MNDVVERELKLIADKEAPARKILADPDSTPQQRFEALGLMNEAQIHVRGMLHMIRVLKGEDKAHYYNDFFSQARSDEGLADDQSP